MRLAQTVHTLHVNQQYICSPVADAAMGGPGGRPPPTLIDQNLGLVMAAPLRHGGKFSLKSLTFGHFLYKNVQKLSASGGLRPLIPSPHQALPLDPAGGSATRPPFRLALRALAMVRPHPFGKSWIRHCFSPRL